MTTNFDTYSKNNTMRQSKSVLHDIIKSVINYYPLQIMEICKRIPETKNSNVLKKGYWKFTESREEQINIKWKQADAVWFYADDEGNTFFVVHEIKTGFFDVADIHRKYHTGMNVQIWVWAFRTHTPKTKPPHSMKIVPIESIGGYVLQLAHSSLDYLHGSDPF